MAVSDLVKVNFVTYNEANVMISSINLQSWIRIFHKISAQLY